MQEENNSPRFVQDLLRVHRAITRGLSVSTEKGAEFIQAGFPDPALRKGYTVYALGLADVLQEHHIGEDEVAFPTLSMKIQDAPYEQLSRHHQEIKTLLGSVRETLPLVEETEDPANLVSLVDVLFKIYNVWRPHIQAEEIYFSEEAVSEVMSSEELDRLSAAMGKHSQEHTTQPYIAIPFFLFNMDAQDRAVMSASMPTVIVEELIPKVWKEQWAPMKPFLLDQPFS